ncbi:MAG TPA: TetR family transcriptional regulator [Oscillatoriaceae cyanobacterium]
MASDTRSRILETALRLFNERGLNAVGVREIARELDMSPGNLAYHFPQKEVLVATLVKELHNANSRRSRPTQTQTPTMVTFYASVLGVMHNHLAYRFYQISYAEILLQSPELRETELSLMMKRRMRTQAAFDGLSQSGRLDGDRLAGHTDQLHELLTILMTSWLRAATVYMPDAGDDAILLHYGKLALALFEPYCTPTGAEEVRAIRTGAHDAEILAALDAQDTAASV